MRRIAGTTTPSDEVVYPAVEAGLSNPPLTSSFRLIRPLKRASILYLMNAQTSLRNETPARYRLRLQGARPGGWGDWLDHLEVAVEGAGPEAVTLLTGEVRDQSALFGLLGCVRDLGIPLILVELVEIL